MPKSVDSISLEMIWAIPSGFYGKLFPRCGILREHLVTVEAGMVESDFRGVVNILLFNHHPKKAFTVRAGDRTAQVVFMKKFTTKFQRVTDKHLLRITKRVSDGFGSTGIFLIKKKVLQKKICILLLKKQMTSCKQLLKKQLLQKNLKSVLKRQ